MIVCGTVFFLFTVGFVLVQGILVGLYVRKMRQATSKKDDFQPSVAIVLCVRGLDPSLEDCLKALVAQDYRRKKIFVVGDHEQDHGLQLARKMSQQEPGLLSVHVNNEILQTCSVKCSHLISMTRQIESEFDLIALVDADTVPDESWLESMVQPFVDSDVNATTGVRWFSVGGKKWGSWVRYIWNTAAIVQMVCYRIPWGGSLALRSSFLREADVLDEWSRGFCEDTMLQKLSRRTGGRIEVVPEAVISSEEETSLARCIPWISRQLLTARLHHPRWPLVLAHGLATGLLTWGSLVLGIVSLAMNLLLAAACFLAAHVLLQLCNIGLLNWIESPVLGIRKMSAAMSRDPLRFFLAIPLTQFCYVMAMGRTLLSRVVEWRNVTYRIRRGRTELLDFGPYDPDQARDYKEAESL